MKKNNNTQLLCVAALAGAGIYLLNKKKQAVSGIGVIYRDSRGVPKYGGIDFLRASSPEEVLSILQRRFPHGVQMAYVNYIVQREYGEPNRKRHTVSADGKMGGAGICISISKKTADALVNDYNFQYEKDVLYDRV